MKLLFATDNVMEIRYFQTLVRKYDNTYIQGES